ncbi:MAG TPA: hypothetical protein VKY24_04440 [Reyranella sp.]|nr:hypothetical protein [Reyranella sp.]
MRSPTGTLQAVVAGPAGPAVAGASAGARTQALSSYSLQGVYFNPKQFDSAADCLTAASSHGLPLDVCQ